MGGGIIGAMISHSSSVKSDEYAGRLARCSFVMHNVCHRQSRRAKLSANIRVVRNTALGKQIHQRSRTLFNTL
jgi:hypothetical protein